MSALDEAIEELAIELMGYGTNAVTRLWLARESQRPEPSTPALMHEYLNRERIQDTMPGRAVPPIRCPSCDFFVDTPRNHHCS